MISAPPSRRQLSRIDRVDWLALCLLLGTILFSVRDILFDPMRAGLDTVTFFWPMYAFLGGQLKSGIIPGWNPYQFSGVPFLADPESGWWYAPAMAVFGILPLAAAVKVYAAVHVLIAGFGTYAYGRLIGMVPAGALVAAWAVSQGGLFTDRSRCCYAHIQVAAWIPIVLLAVELAIRATRSKPRFAAWTLGGFAIGQMLAGWIGQGAMYGLLLTGAYVAFRTLAKPHDPTAPLRHRVADATAHLMTPVVLGFGLSAPGTLPRLLYRGETTLADGYSGSASWAARLGGWNAGTQIEQLVSPSGWFLGTSVLLLSLAAVIASWRSGYVRFFAALTLASFVLGLERDTIIHQLFSIIPGFSQLHSHFPERIALILVFGPAILAGLGISALQRQTSPRSVLAALALAGLAAMGVGLAGLDPGPTFWITMFLMIALLGVLTIGAVTESRVMLRSAPIALALIVIAELSVLAAASLAEGMYVRIGAASIADRNETARILHEEGEGQPPRFFGYDPALSYEQHGQTTYYRHDFEDPMTFELLVNNHGTLWRLADIQGYNPLQLRRYADFLTALNGTPQEYHGAYVLSNGLSSPLLPLLSPDYIVIPKTVLPDRPDLQHLVRAYPEAASTASVRILEYGDAMPRAWIVHKAVEADRGDVPALLAGGGIDLRTTAVVESPPPPLDPPGARITEAARVTAYEPNRIELDATSDGRGLLVLSETYANGWSAKVDGAEAEVMPVDGVLRGIPIPGGQHAVTLTFRAPGLDAGFAVFGLTGVMILAATRGASWLDRRVSLRGARPAATPGSAGAGRRA